MSVTLNITASFGSSRTGLAGRVAYSLDGGTTWITSGITEPIAGSGNYQASVTVTPPLVVNWKTGDSDRVSTTLTLTASGSGYTNGTGYALTFTGGLGTGAAGTFDVVGGAVTNLVLTNQGSGYTSAPTITFTTAGAGTGATATATLVTQRYASESIAPVIAASVTGDVGGSVAAVTGAVGSVTGNVGGSVGSVADAGASLTAIGDTRVASINTTLTGFTKYQISGTVQDTSPTAGGFIVTFANGFASPQTNVLVGRQLAFSGGANWPDKQQITGYTYLSATTARLTFTNPFAGSPANGDPFNIL